MPKETETEETTLFYHTFVIDGNSIGEAGLRAPPGYVYVSCYIQTSTFYV